MSKYPIRIILFWLTVVSTFVTGYQMGGGLIDGALYCVSIMGILLAHEMGHYLMCRRYGVQATLPIFIPMPLNLFGTMGAVIRIKSPIPHRRALFDIGVAGPLAGIALAAPIAIVGMKWSHVVDNAMFSDAAITLGEPLFFRLLAHLQFGSIPPGSDVSIHPVAFAAWTGFFVTALNLLPVGQLDGGHVIYALFGRQSRYVFAGILGLVVTLSITTVVFPTYGVILLIFVLIFGLEHPPTIYDFVPLDGKRRFVALAVLLVFIICFTPYPLYMKSG
ncbi:MAG: site-2 protease family protein [Planctomycetota bacterium]